MDSEGKIIKADKVTYTKSKEFILAEGSVKVFDTEGNLLITEKASYDKIKEIRGKGLLTAFQMHNHKKLDGHHVSIELLNKGIYAKETHRHTVRIAPALTIEA